jgi:hypothetical protein
VISRRNESCGRWDGSILFSVEDRQMSKTFDDLDGFEIKTGDRFVSGLIDINWEERTLILTGIGGQADEMDPHEVWLGLKNGPPDGFERRAVVVLDLNGDAFQLAHYNLKQFEKECYGPVEHTTSSACRMD